MSYIIHKLTNGNLIVWYRLSLTGYTSMYKSLINTPVKQESKKKKKKKPYIYFEIKRTSFQIYISTENKIKKKKKKGKSIITL